MMIALVLAICWTYAQDNRGRIVNFFFINIPCQYLPYAMLLLTLIQAGPDAAMSEAVGIPAAHLYEFLTHYWPTYGGGVNLIPTPTLFTNYFSGVSGTKRVDVKGHGTAFRAPATAPATGASSSSSVNWGQRGAGRRLGGD